MTFEDRWENTWKESGLPNTARVQIPDCLSDGLKKLLTYSKKNDVESGRVFSKAVDEINHGSVAGIEELIKEKLD